MALVSVSPTTSGTKHGPAYALKDSPANKKNSGNSKDRGLRFDMVRLLELVICVLTFEIIDNFLRQFSYPVPAKSIFNCKLSAIRLDPGKHPELTAGPAGKWAAWPKRAVSLDATPVAETRHKKSPANAGLQVLP